MNPDRIKILAGIAALLLALLIWNWISGWGLVTVHVNSEPLAKVVRSIERQGGIKIVTNADLTTPVTMDVDRVPAVSAVDTLAAWVDGNWSVTYAAGATKSDVIAGINALQDDGRSPDFARFGGGWGGGGGGFGGSDVVIDVRRVAWKVSPSDDQQLQTWINQLSQKTGLTAIVPQTWNPKLPDPPKGGAAGAALRDLVGAVKGQIEEVFVIRVQKEDPMADAGRGGGRPGGMDGGFGGGRPEGGDRGGFNPEWMAERQQARIALLPAAERVAAQKDFDDMRATWQKMRSLPEAERRAAMQKMFNDPVMQEKMMDRMLSRDAKRSPEKRAERFRQYLQRKQQIKAAQ